MFGASFEFKCSFVPCIHLTSFFILLGYFFYAWPALANLTKVVLANSGTIGRHFFNSFMIFLVQVLNLNLYLASISPVFSFFQAIFSRVARVCKSDQGGPRKFRDNWTTFLKSRLNCSVPGEHPFYFDQIQATSGLVDGHLIYGVFTTPDNAISGSAICAFSLKDITER